MFCFKGGRPKLASFDLTPLGMLQYLAMDIQQHVSLASRHTFALSAEAQYYAQIHSVADMQTLIQAPLWKQQPYLILGEGSNTLFIDDFQGLVIANRIKGIEIVKETDDNVWLKAGAGENWHQLVIYCIEHNYAGLENLSLIPGSVGAAPVQNIGAYGVELKDLFFELEAIDLATGELKKFSNAECKFAYRDSRFKHELKNKFLICYVTLRLNKKPVFNVGYGQIKEKLAEMQIKMLSIKAISQAIMAIRNSKLPDPAKLPNAGSFFKNPIVSKNILTNIKNFFPQVPNYDLPDGSFKIPAAWLIEQSGWKGRRLGSVGVHEKQALVLVNYGGASGQDVLALAEKIQQDVQNKFNIHLQAEVNIVK